MTPKRMIACRDPLGIRPLVMGRIGDATVFASESVALDVVGAEFVREVEPGEIVEVRTMISHPMENGRRRDATGALVPRRIINRFTCSLDGEPVIDIELHTSVAASPYIAFDLMAERPGRLQLRWHDDDGGMYAAEVPLELA